MQGKVDKFPLVGLLHVLWIDLGNHIEGRIHTVSFSGDCGGTLLVFTSKDGRHLYLKVWWHNVVNEALPDNELLDSLTKDALNPLYGSCVSDVELGQCGVVQASSCFLSLPQKLLGYTKRS